MKADPPVRKDGRCAHCVGPRKAKPNRYSGLAATLDPFCSTGCCRAWHGVADRPRDPLPRRAYAS